jgi:hypothetical protein
MHFDATNAAAVQQALPNKLLLTLGEASKALSISPGMLRKQARLGRIKVTHIGRCARISQEEVVRLSKGGVK